MMLQPGKLLMATGAVLLLLGFILWLPGSKLNWIGRLPGDILIDRENFRFYFPITTMILVSIILSAIIWFIRKLF